MLRGGFDFADIVIWGRANKQPRATLDVVGLVRGCIATRADQGSPAPLPGACDPGRLTGLPARRVIHRRGSDSIPTSHLLMVTHSPGRSSGDPGEEQWPGETRSTEGASVFSAERAWRSRSSFLWLRPDGLAPSALHDGSFAGCRSEQLIGLQHHAW